MRRAGRAFAGENMQKKTPEDVTPAWHNETAEFALERLETAQAGLSFAEAERRLSVYGKNRLPEGARRSGFVRFLLQFHNILIYVLLGCALVTGLLNHWIDTAVILAVVVINAIIGYIQEGKAERAMDAIRHMLAPHANVLRDGQRVNVEGDSLVPGDIVLLEAGDKAPADVRLLTAHGLSAQESILTGESAPVEKRVAPAPLAAALGDRVCMVFSGTLITSGQGKGVVTATGSRTEIGRISGLLEKVETLTTPLVEQMAVFAKWLTFVILGVAALLLVYGRYIGRYEFTEMFMAVVGLSVAAIPEGLPAVLTITLAIGVQAMARRNAIVRRLPAIETLGAVSVICTDKTGTLTRNEMMAASVLTYQHLYTLDGEGYAPSGALRLDETRVAPADEEVLGELARAAALCNDAELRQHAGVWTVEGDPMEGALLAFAGKMDVDGRKVRAVWPRTDAIPFDARHRYMATLHHDHEGHAFVFVKGAPETILAMCRDQRVAGGKTAGLDNDYWTNRAETIAGLGQRVLALAVKPIAAEQTVLTQEYVQSGLTLVGMTGLIDPPRPEAIAAIAECQGAGIRVKMITGDHAKTAAAIGKQIGLQNSEAVLTGADLDAMDDAALRETALTCDIFARTSPEHKLRLVMALQSHGMIVAMTGDGVNDAPALKRADAGVAMGLKGSEAAKEAAEVVLADDNFASIVAAVREGRTVYDNITKVISWTLPTSTGEAMTVIVALLLGLTLPVTPVQILWINLITAATLGIALAFEPTEAGTMLRRPRKRSEPLLSGALMWHIVLVSFLFLAGVYSVYNFALSRGYSLELARTITLNTLVVMEIFHLFFIRNIHSASLTWQALRGTREVWIVVAIIAVAQFAITYLPPMQRVFETVAIPFWDGMLIIGVGAALFAIIEAEKRARRRLASYWLSRGQVRESL